MYTDLSTPRVLIMEWVDGERLKSSAQGGGGREELQMVEIGVRCSLEQMLEEGYYHSDPHPGNLFKMKTGKLAYIDFGMMGEIQGSIRRCCSIKCRATAYPSLFSTGPLCFSLHCFNVANSLHDEAETDPEVLFLLLKCVNLTPRQDIYCDSALHSRLLCG